MPLFGSRISFFILAFDSKSNMFAIEFAMVSNEPLPIRSPFSQLSSTKRMTEVWSVSVWSTKFCLAQGEMTISGWRGP